MCDQQQMIRFWWWSRNFYKKARLSLTNQLTCLCKQLLLGGVWSCWWPHVQSGRWATDTSVRTWTFKEYWNS